MPYVKSLWNALGEERSYFSANPKSTNTGIFLWESRMLAGLWRVQIWLAKCNTKAWTERVNDVLDIVMHDPTLVEEVDTIQQ
jgi:hypothetical protein